MDDVAAGAAPVVLIADDDEVVRTLVSRSLTANGYRVLKTSDGLETLRVMTRWEPALLLLDIGMPGLDGKAVARIVRSMGPAAPIVVFLTADTSDDSRAEGLGLGAADYITKPFASDDLRARVAAALEGQSGTPAH
ncbi:MAG: hypothetical protein QOJ07_973 [Thermoleophilaceae bacterium]|jgi:DNA-binding response OmpR family regulator|nr:hypothetical protein [Thermoleophilaceae bacterium]